jgi:hypothetical protein
LGAPGRTSHVWKVYLQKMDRVAPQLNGSANQDAPIFFATGAGLSFA